ncbi:MAG: cytochrome C oxidase subunit IV family protein [Planctomyces sp.]
MSVTLLDDRVMSHNDHHSHSDDTHHVNYLSIFFVLCLCTVLSVTFDVLHFAKPVTIVLVFAVAVAKALCVMMFFMHLKFEGNWKYVLLAPTTILAIGLPLALMPDIGASYYPSAAPQVHGWGDEFREWKAHHDEAAHGNAEHSHAEGATDAPAHDASAPHETPAVEPGAAAAEKSN